MIGLSYKNKPLYGLIFFPELKKYYFNNNISSFVFMNNKKKQIYSRKNRNLKNSYLITNSIHTIKNNKMLNFFQNYKNLLRLQERMLIILSF